MHPYTIDLAEHDIRAALDAGDPERIEILTYEVDQRPAVSVVAVSLHASALWYADQGLRVFPLSPRSKIPTKGSAGCKDATTDADQITAWWTERPDANIGIATGYLVDVVDIDGIEGQTSRAKLWEKDGQPYIFAKIDADSVAKVLTPRPGGMHIYVPATGDGNGANIAPGVDYRGLGGYVVAPPSVNDQGAYRFLGTPHFGEVAA